MQSKRRILSIERPDLLKEWDYEKNSLICSPDSITTGSNKKVWWKCNRGHSYQQTTDKRVSRNYGCPFCSGKKILSGFNDLQTLNPKLVKDWDYNKNIHLDPASISLHSNKKVWWKCSDCGHEWYASINDRANGRGCPECAKKRRADSYRKSCIKKGFNDFVSVRPDLLKEWDYGKNVNIFPDNYTINSMKKVWWRCSVCGNEWQATIANRTNRNSGCPKCMRHQRTSFPEQALFYYIKKLYPKTENGYTTIFAPSLKELDIFIPEINVGIEYDGIIWHSDNRSTKIGKEKYFTCKKNSIKLIRVSEDEDNNKEYCDYYVYREDFTSEGLNEAIRKTISIISDAQLTIDTEKDRSKIMKQYITVIKNKSIAVKYPDVLSQWDLDKNDGITPDMVNAMTNVKYWWKCDKGHSYQSTPANKLSKNQGCPICSGQQVLPGFNDLETRYPKVVKEWDFTKNTILPSEIMPGSQRKYWWKCDKGHSYQKTPNDRTANNAGCPYCSGRVALKGYNDFATINKEYLKLWDFDKNTFKPDEITSRSGRIAWWKCDKGHSWQKRIVSQLNHNYCPVCKGTLLEKGQNDFKTLYPELIKDWDYEKNKIRPEEITKTYNKYIWWKCKDCGNSWKAKIYSRTKGTGCPKCGYSKKMQKTREQNTIKNKKDLASKFPDIAKEWDYEKNGNLDPSKISFGSNIKVWWKCSDCGHEWQAWLTDRTGKRGYGCPKCRKANKYTKNKNDY